MGEVGDRALKPNASAVVADVAGGEVITITDRGRPVAQMIPILNSNLQLMIESGRALLTVVHGCMGAHDCQIRKCGLN